MKWTKIEAIGDIKKNALNQTNIDLIWLTAFQIYLNYRRIRLCLSKQKTKLHNHISKSSHSTHKIIPTFKCIAKQYRYYLYVII